METILYGLVGYEEELERKRKEGRISYGGCCITLDDPAWECTKCGLKVYKKLPSIFDEIETQEVKEILNNGPCRSRIGDRS